MIQLSASSKSRTCDTSISSQTRTPTEPPRSSLLVLNAFLTSMTELKASLRKSLYSLQPPFVAYKKIKRRRMLKPKFRSLLQLAKALSGCVFRGGFCTYALSTKGINWYSKNTRHMAFTNSMNSLR